jgi:hypothetical protein
VPCRKVWGTREDFLLDSLFFVHKNSTIRDLYCERLPFRGKSISIRTCSTFSSSRKCVNEKPRALYVACFDVSPNRYSGRFIRAGHWPKAVGGALWSSRLISTTEWVAAIALKSFFANIPFRAFAADHLRRLPK